MFDPVLFNDIFIPCYLITLYNMHDPVEISNLPTFLCKQMLSFKQCVSFSILYNYMLLYKHFALCQICKLSDPMSLYVVV